MNFVYDSFLYQHVSEPTNYRATQNPTLIDLVFTNEEGMVKNLIHEQPVGKSHHVCIYFDYLCYTENQASQNEVRYNYMKANYDEMRKFMTEQHISEHIATKSVEEAGAYLYKLFQTAMNEHVPRKKCKAKYDGKTKPPWWSKAASDKIDEKKLAFEKWNRSQDQDDWIKYAKIRNECKNACRWAKRGYEKNLAMEAKINPKPFYSHVNNMMKVKEGVGDLINSELVS